MRIGEREIGPGQEPYIIAEIGVNHDGDAARAVTLTHAAADAGADAVKLQLFETDRLMSRAAKLAAYQAASGERDPFSMLRRLELSIHAMAGVVDAAHARGIHAIVSVFSVELVPVAQSLAARGAGRGWDAYKTASPDIIHRPLLEALMATGLPMVVSTGASTLDEVRRAAGWMSAARDRLALLQCVSSYPAPTLALEGIPAIAAATGLVCGYSDHTPDCPGARAAVAAGACILEKHITDDPTRAGPDHAASLRVEQLRAYREAARAGWRDRSDGGRAASPAAAKGVLDCERDVREKSRQSLVAVRDLPAGDVLRREDVTIKRPGTGLPPFELGRVIGRRTTRALAADMPIEADGVEGMG